MVENQKKLKMLIIDHAMPSLFDLFVVFVLGPENFQPFHPCARTT